MVAERATGAPLVPRAPQTAQVRAKMVEVLRQEFSAMELTYSIGGQISFDVRGPPAMPCMTRMSFDNSLLRSAHRPSLVHALGAWARLRRLRAVGARRLLAG